MRSRSCAAVAVLLGVATLVLVASLAARGPAGGTAVRALGAREGPPPPGVARRGDEPVPRARAAPRSVPPLRAAAEPSKQVSGGVPSPALRVLLAELEHAFAGLDSGRVLALRDRITGHLRRYPPDAAALVNYARATTTMVRLELGRILQLVRDVAPGAVRRFFAEWAEETADRAARLPDDPGELARRADAGDHAAFEKLVRTSPGSPEAEAWIERMLASPRPEERALALHAVASAGLEDRREMFVAGLGDPDVRVRRTAVRVLGFGDPGDAQAAELLAEHASSADEITARFAVAGLRRLSRSPEATRTLAGLAWESRDPDLRVSAVHGLAVHAAHQPRAMDELVRVMRTAEAWLAAEAVRWAWAHLGDRAPLDVFHELASRSGTPDGEAAQEALRQLAPRGAAGRKPGDGEGERRSSHGERQVTRPSRS